jgi:hypothetical protein
MAIDRNQPTFGPFGVKARGASSAQASVEAIIATSGDSLTATEKTMNNAITYTGTAYAEALTTLAKRDASLASAQTAFALLAGTALIIGEKTFADIVEDACNATNSRGKPTNDNPKGKANPNALKTNGFSGIARVVGLFKKIDAHMATNEAVGFALWGFVGHIADMGAYEAAKESDERIIAALESGDDAKLASAERRFHNGYVNGLYTNEEGAVIRPDSFAALERAVVKAIDAAKPRNTSASEGEGEGEGISADASIITAGMAADALATAFIGKIADASDDTLTALLEAIKSEYERRAEGEETAKAA